MRCMYCLPCAPEGGWVQRSDLLTFEEIERLVRLLAGMGIDRIRLTGGEPLLRNDLPELVGRLRSVPGIGGIALTTNGFGLARHALELKEAGVSTVNVSLDSLRRDRFMLITGVDALTRVLHSIASAAEVGLRVKINCVLIRGVNDDEIESIARLAEHDPYVVRFIEFMPFDGSGLWNQSRVVSHDEVVQRLATSVALEPTDPPVSDGPAREYLPAGWAGRIGIIPSVTRPFCNTCNRLRLTSDGRLVSCLYARDRSNNLKAVLRSGGSDAGLESLIREVVSRKPAGCIEWLKGDDRRPAAAVPPPGLRLRNPMHLLGG